MSRGPVEAEEKERDLFALPELVPGMLQKARSADLVPERPKSRLAALFRRQADAVAQAVSLEYERGVLALLAPIAIGLGAFTYLTLRLEPSWLHVINCLVALCVLAYAVRNRALALTLVAAMLLFAIGMACAKLEVTRVGTKVLGGEISTRLTGRVVDIDHLANGRVRLILDVLGTQRPTLRYQPQRVRVTVPRLKQDVRSGTVVEGVVRLQPPPGPIRPGGYDFSFESYFDGVGANGFFMGTPRIVEHGDPAPATVRFRAALDNARNRIAERIRNVVPGAGGEIAAALMVGVRAGIPEGVNESLRKTGLAHILSISGLHMALVAASVILAVRLMLSLLPGFAARHPAKKIAASAALLVLTSYLFVSGAEVAAQRSFIMIAVMLTAVLFDRQALTMRNLAISAIIVLLISPHEIVGPSFQMSFAATAALIGGYAAWTDWRRRHPRRRSQERTIVWNVLNRLALSVLGVAATAILAGLATTIFGIWHFQRVSPLALFANLGVTPFVSLIVMPFGLLAMLAMPFGLDGPFLAVMGWGLSAMLAVSDYLAARTPLDAVGTISGVSVLLLTAALLAATLATTRLRWIGAGLALGGIALASPRTVPDMLIADDARLVGVMNGKGALLINRKRPNGFTSQGWQRVLTASTVVTPVDVAAENSSSDKRTDRLSYTAAQRFMDMADTDSFRCAGPLCVVRHEAGGTVAVVSNAWTAQQICRLSTLVVVQQANARNICSDDGRNNIITSKMLARQGAATVKFDENVPALGPPPGFTTTFSITEPFRPWHHHRQYSRAARGMLPYQRVGVSQSSKPGSARRANPEP